VGLKRRWADPHPHGEFRKHIRELCTKEWDVTEIDNLFDEWDTDRSGKIDMLEMAVALRGLRDEYLRKHGRHGWKFGLQEQMLHIRGRELAARTAINAAERADRIAAELQAQVEKIDGSVEVQLGVLLSKRRVNVGEIVGTWAKSRSRGGKRELSRAEFKDEIERLGLTVKGVAVSRKQLGALFDCVDTDRSATLDLEETMAALRKWQTIARTAIDERSKLDQKVVRLRVFAAKKLQLALRAPESPGSPSSLSRSSGSEQWMEGFGMVPTGASPNQLTIFGALPRSESATKLPLRKQASAADRISIG